MDYFMGWGEDEMSTVMQSTVVSSYKCKDKPLRPPSKKDLLPSPQLSAESACQDSPPLRSHPSCSHHSCDLVRLCPFGPSADGQHLLLSSHRCAQSLVSSASQSDFSLWPTLPLTPFLPMCITLINILHPKIHLKALILEIPTCNIYYHCY